MIHRLNRTISVIIAKMLLVIVLTAIIVHLPRHIVRLLQLIDLALMCVIVPCLIPYGMRRYDVVVV